MSKTSSPRCHSQSISSFGGSVQDFRVAGDVAVPVNFFSEFRHFRHPRLPAEGSASVSGSSHGFHSGGDFQQLLRDVPLADFVGLEG